MEQPTTETYMRLYNSMKSLQGNQLVSVCERIHTLYLRRDSLDSLLDIICNVENPVIQQHTLIGITTYLEKWGTQLEQGSYRQLISALESILIKTSNHVTRNIAVSIFFVLFLENSVVLQHLWNIVTMPETPLHTSIYIVYKMVPFLEKADVISSLPLFEHLITSVVDVFPFGNTINVINMIIVICMSIGDPTFASSIVQQHFVDVLASGDENLLSLMNSLIITTLDRNMPIPDFSFAVKYMIDALLSPTNSFLFKSHAQVLLNAYFLSSTHTFTTQEETLLLIDTELMFLDQLFSEDIEDTIWLTDFIETITQSMQYLKPKDLFAYVISRYETLRGSSSDSSYFTVVILIGFAVYTNKNLFDSYLETFFSLLIGSISHSNVLISETSSAMLSLTSNCFGNLISRHLFTVLEASIRVINNRPYSDETYHLLTSSIRLSESTDSIFEYFLPLTLEMISSGDETYISNGSAILTALIIKSSNISKECVDFIYGSVLNIFINYGCCFYQIFNVITSIFEKYYGQVDRQIHVLIPILVASLDSSNENQTNAALTCFIRIFSVLSSELAPWTDDIFSKLSAIILDNAKISDLMVSNAIDALSCLSFTTFDMSTISTFSNLLNGLICTNRPAIYITVFEILANVSQSFTNLEELPPSFVESLSLYVSLAAEMTKPIGQNLLYFTQVLTSMNRLIMSFGLAILGNNESAWISNIYGVLLFLVDKVCVDISYFLEELTAIGDTISAISLKTPEEKWKIYIGPFIILYNRLLDNPNISVSTCSFLVLSGLVSLRPACFDEKYVNQLVDRAVLWLSGDNTFLSNSAAQALRRLVLTDESCANRLEEIMNSVLSSTGLKEEESVLTLCNIMAARNMCPSELISSFGEEKRRTLLSRAVNILLLSDVDFKKLKIDRLVGSTIIWLCQNLDSSGDILGPDVQKALDGDEEARQSYEARIRSLHSFIEA